MMEKFIDVKNVIRSKNPRLLSILPNFVLNYIKKVIHEDEINASLWRNKNLFDLDFVSAALEEFGAKIELIGKENIPEKGGYIFVANHPLGGLDGLAFMKGLGTIRKDIKFLVNDILLNLKNINTLFVPVNKLGRNSHEIMENIEKTYASDKAILVFPAGLVSRKQSKGIKDLVWKKSFITMAKKYQKNIIPVYIEGKNSRFFYELAWLRKRLGIKANIEMFYLVDEMYKQKNKTITLIFGAQIPHEVLDETLTSIQWAEKIKEHVYAIGKMRKPIAFDPQNENKTISV